ncbi:MAG: HAMP domain-containing sensor histidine kinase, partial [Bacteroidales bacterium]|nr:HAMP domain-containing sensor histidine kinase [Bacteroidales bacterium]
QFLTVLSHELKAPLNAIEGYLKIMQERQAGDNLEAYEKMIDRSLSRVKAMRTMIMDLLDLTRIESEGKKRDLRELDLGLVAKSAIDTMIPLAIQRDVKIIYDSSTSVSFVGDSKELEIVFNNLLSNAVKYNIEGGQVNCSIKANESEVVIEIIDTGVGIAEEDLPKLFREFSRIKTSKTKEISGSGLGLSIIKRIVDLYKGSVDVESEFGKGTTFRVNLPIIPSINEITGI